MTVTLAKWTIADYHQMIQAGLLDDRAVELLRGEIVEMPPESEQHAYYSRTAADYLVLRLGQRALVSAEKPITLPNDSEPEPDIAIVQRLGREYLQHHPYPENVFWVIEYAQTSLVKDQTIKYQIYAEAGIPEYWLVNLARRELIVFRDPQGQDYRSKMTWTEGEICPVAFPDVAIAVEQIIAP